MKRAFVRGLWGIYSKENRLVERRYKMDSDIKQTLKNKNSPPSITYVYGEDNYKCLKEMGVEGLKLVNKDPFKYHLTNHQYRHKLEIYQLAMEDYDEIVYIDWDVDARKKLPDDFWKVLGQRDYCQANLQQYKRRKCPWRKNGDQRKVPNGGFLYIRDKSFPDEIVTQWDKRSGNSDEPAIASAIDVRTDGWQGMDYYWEHHEPDFCNLWKFSAFPQKMIKTKNVSFVHHQGLPSYRYSKETKSE